MTNQDKFIETFGIDAWRQMISFSGIAEQFKEFWTSKYEKPEHTGIDFISDLDKIRVEIKTKFGNCDICEYFEDYDFEENAISEYRPIGNITDILQIIDKYRRGEADCRECKAEYECYECEKYEESEGKE